MTEHQCVRLAISSLLEVVDSGAKTMEICVVRSGGKKEMLSESAIESFVKEIEAEQQEGGTAATTPATITT